MNDKIEKSSVDEIFELNMVQKGMLYHYLKEDKENQYNVQLSFSMEGDLDIDLFKKAFGVVQSNNEVLRSVFRWEKVSKPIQIVLKECPIDFIHHDISKNKTSSESDFVLQYLIKDRNKRFDLTDLVLRLSIIKTSAQAYVFVITHHHILYDGWSTGILLKELFSCYQQLQESKRPISLPKPAYKEVKSALKRDILNSGDKLYWKNYLEGYEHSSSILENNPWGSKDKQVEKLRLTHSYTNLENFARSNKLTKASIMYTAYGILLQKYTDASDVIFGTTVSNRNSSIQGIGQFMGNFINSIPLRVKDLEGKTLLEAASSLNEDLIKRNQFHHSSLYEINQIVGRKSGDALFDITLGIENYPLDENILNSIHGLNIELNSVYENTNVSLAVTITFREELEVDFNYKKNVLSADFVKSFANNFMEILDEITARPDKKVESLDVLSDQERNLLINEFNASQVDYPDSKTIVDLFEEQLMQTPDHNAVAYEDTRITYKELNDRSNELALRIKEQANAEEIAGIYVTPSPEMVIGILAILKAGLGFMPLDPNQPAGRLEYMLKDSQCKLLLTTESSQKDFSFKGEKIIIDSRKQLNDFEKIDTKTKPGDLAYVIYTSGSTGKPKGVKITHGNLVNYSSWLKQELKLTSVDKSVLTSSYAFDLGYTSIFPALISGSEIHLVPKTLYYSAEGLLDYISGNNISYLKLTPSLFNTIVGADNFGSVSLTSLKHILLGGESMITDDIETARKSYPDVGFINHYGPTEATIGCIANNVDSSDFSQFIERPTIGKPISNTKAYILSKKGEVLPIGCKGELCIGGAGVTLGYLGNKKLTKEKFLSNPFVPGEKMYKTGDLARWLPEGTIEFLGRIDQQVKIRGYRIELGEIENQLASHKRITECSVQVREIEADKSLVAYYVSNDEVSSEEFRRYLSERLPDYMIPSRYVRLDQMPLTSNGKLDRKSLPDPDVQATHNIVKASNEVEETLVEIWGEVLGHENISIHNNFFEIGGDSLKLIRVNSLISRKIEGKVQVTDLFEFPTIKQLAQFISAGQKNQTEHQKSKSKAAQSPKRKASGDQAYEDPDIAVIGMAGRFPGAKNVNEFWENLKSGTDSVSREIEGISKDSIIKAKGVLEESEMFEASFFNYTPEEADLMDPQMRVFHECSWEALEDAGYNPYKYEGAIGVYGGASPNPFYAPRLGQDNPEEWMDQWQSHIYSTHDFLCSRVSYKLNLRGPSVNVATACSTSLVAIDAACRDLLDGRCDMALSGGVSLTFHDTAGYKYKKDMILSPDGYCRAFDKNAAGTVGGNGVGIVLLKKLKDALRDGDNIHAIIKGSAINNDGIQKVGFTAPSITGQADVIQSAMRNADIHPESISYVETHGTGTLLGDPIELEGLKRAFNSDKERFCAIGSVKTNFGHLNAAAGVTGLIKTVLSLKHRQIPPSLHFESANEALGIEQSPFYVNDKLQNWETNGSPRRAGVSSFGIGGTNAHIILEEAPHKEQVSESRDYQLMVLSAKTQAALDRNMANLKSYLETNESEKIENIAYTLNQGRAPFNYRKFIVCENRNEAIDLLASKATANARGPVRHYEGQTIAFMFPGQGAQYHNMLHELYKGEDDFREEVDQCFEIVKNISGKDLKAVVFGNPGPKGKNSINNTEFTQPLLFITEYALARLLMKWGIQPDIMIGHSIGEYAAACISGIFSLEDALTLVVKRGELMQKLPAGSMLSIAISEEELKPFLDTPRQVSLAVVNSSKSCVVSGNDQAIGEFQELIEKEGYKSKAVECSHAFHSYMMDDILDEFEEVVRSVNINPQQIPFISNLSGIQADDHEIREAAYWVRHLRETVRFSEGIQAVMANKKAVFIEVGPSSILSSLVQSNEHREAGHKAVNLVRHPKEKKNDWQYILSALGNLYLNGVEVDWQAFYSNEERRKVSLPTYSFEKIKYPVKTQVSISQPTRLEDQLVRIDDVSEWFYIPTWKMLPLLVNEPVVDKTLGNIIFADDCGLSEALIKKFRQNEEPVICVRKGASFKEESPILYRLNPNSEEDVNTLFERLTAYGMSADRIIHLWSVDHKKDGAFSMESCLASCNTHFYSLIHAVKAAHLHKAFSNTQLVLLTNDLQSVLGNEDIHIAKSMSPGLLKVISQEYPTVSTSHIDIALSEVENDVLIDRLYQEIKHSETGKTVAFRNSRRWVQIFEQIKSQTTANSKPTILRTNGVYLITGGLGDLGFSLAKHLLKTYQAKVILTGRSQLPSESAWSAPLQQANLPDDTKRKIEKLNDLQELGGEVIYVSCEVSDLVEMQKVVKQAEDKFGPVNGVIHAAGIIGKESKRPIKILTRKDIEYQLLSKVAGTHVLKEILHNKKLDFCILTSSLSTILGGLGFAAYASANMYMDYFAQASLTNWTSVNFDGLNLNEGKGEGINTEELIDVFDRILSLISLPQVAVSVGDLNKRLDKWIYRKTADRIEEKPLTYRLANKTEPVLIDENEPILPLEQALLTSWQNFFGSAEIDVDDSFFAVGGDSLKALQMISRIHEEFNIELSIEQLFANPTIRELALLLDDTRPKTVSIEKESKVTFTKIPKAPVKDFYQLSSVQQRLYFLNEFDKNSLAYNMPLVLTLEGALDPARLRSTFNELGDRHESLRTFFDIADGSPVQRVAELVGFQIEYFQATEEEVQSIIESFIRPFDLGIAPLMRVGLIKVSADTHILMVDMHHLVNDGVSRGVLIRDFMALYNQEELLPLQLQYKDYSEWQQNEEQKAEISKQKDFWLDQFSEEVQTLELPLDFARPAIKSYDGDYISFELSLEVTEKLKSIADKEGATMFMVILSIYNILLAKLSLQDDIVIGTSTAGRHQQELENIIGMFVKTIPLRNYPAGNLTFAEFLNNVKSQVIRCFDNQSYPYEDLIDELNIERDTSHNPLFDVLFSYENFSKTDFELPGLTLKPYGYQHTDAKFDLTLIAGELDGQIHLRMNYCVGLFTKETIERFARYFEKVVTTVTSNQGINLRDIDILTDTERTQLLSVFNDTALEYAHKETLVSLFEKQVQTTPDKVAVVYEDQSLTYKELNEGANRLAGLLRKAYGVRPNDVVGIMVRRSEVMMTGLIGILKSGAAYLPIDPDHPQERIEDTLKDSNTSVLITEAGLETDIAFDGEIIYLEKDKSVGGSNPKKINRPDDLCYMIYTSGSTGKPKGVMISHANVVNFFSGMSEKIPTTEEDCMLAVTNTSFDISVLELFWTLCQGIEVVIHPSGISLNNLDRYVPNKDVSMGFGLFYFSSYKNEGDDKYDLLLDSARYADEAGFEALWTPERHFHEFGGLFPNPSVLSSALAMITDQIELRSGSVVLPLHDEIRIVEEWSVVDNLSNGRVAISFAAGWNPNDFVLTQNDFKERHKVMFEKIETVRNLWKGGTISRENGFGKTMELSAFPVPVRPELPVWVTSGGGEETFINAGAIGANLLTHLLGQDTEELSRKISLYREARTANGFKAEDGKVAIMLHTYVGEDLEEVERIVEQPFIQYLESSFALNKAIFEEEGVSEEDLSEEVKSKILKNAFKRYYKSSALIGTKSTCSEMVLKLKQVGVDEIACLVDFGIEQELVMEGLKHLKSLKDLHSGASEDNHSPITMMQSTPSFMNHLKKDAGSQEFLQSLKTLLVGGEAVPLPLISGLKMATDAAIFNMYGPTETTIWSCVYEFNGEEKKVSIGKPIANTQIYILDKERQLVPIGVAGDLYIGGKGLSCEYWKRPELTSEMFVENPFIEGEKIYKSGDSARWLTDGTLEFIGRTDYQVKVKGYRIELGEIEYSLLEYPAINEAIVTVLGDKDAERLVGYLVSNATVDFAEIRAHISKKLPHYMIPTDFVVLDKLPLTSNGKVNRKALPEPVTTAKDNYEAAQTDKEKLLVDVWSKVLDVENIGTSDNFFAVGGDSIKSIQIISRVRNAGYEVSAKDIFISQTIKQLAPKLGEIVALSDQATLTGKGTLSPIQMWYFDRVSVDPHHYNHAVMLNFPDGISRDIVIQIFGKLQEHHDALRTVFFNKGEGMVSEIKGLDMPVSLKEHDLKKEQNPEPVILSLANEIQAGIDLSDGPLMKLGLFHIHDGSRLLIAIHHLVIDGISWRILFEDIEQLHQQFTNKKPLSLPLKTDSFQGWSDHLGEYMKTSDYDKARNYWESLSAKEFDRIQRDKPEGENIGHYSTLEVFTLNLGDTRKLLTEVHEAFGTQINDIMLAALFLAFRKTYGLTSIMVDIEGHGREDLGTHVNVSRTVGWFTSIYRILLEGENDDLSDYIKNIKEAVRQVPNNGLDYLLGKYFDSSGEKADDDPQSKSQVSFNYLGQFNADTKGKSFALVDEPVGDMISPKASLLYDWDIVGLVIEDELEVRLRYSSDQYQKKTINAFSVAYKETLEEIIEYCSTYGKAELTPSDLLYQGLSITQLDKLQDQHNVENVYPLSPMQEAMLFHSLMDPDSAHYFEQLAFDLKGALDISTMEDSINELIKRYDIFRTIFLHKDHEYPLQVVLKERKVDFTYEDLREDCKKASKEEVIQEYKQRDISRKFDLSKDIMMRLTLLRSSTDEFTLIWSYHHIVMDGWCVPIIFNEFKEIYSNLMHGKVPVLPTAKPYANYISWLQERNDQEAMDYWEGYLSGYDSLATLPAKTTVPQSGDRPYDLKSNGLILDKQCVASLNDISKSYGVTVNTIIQLAWSVLLSRYNNVNDVVFGAVVSGRPSEIEGIESMIGMFINTVPIRVSFEQEDTVSSLLKRVQEEVMAGTPYHYSPLSKIHSLNELGTGLLDHIILFDNYPFSEETEDSADKDENGFRVMAAGLTEQSFFDFYLVVVPRDEFHIEFNYNSNTYDGDLIERVKGHFSRIIEQFIQSCEIPLSAIDMISETERHEVLNVFNDTYKGFAKEETFISMFKEQVEKTPLQTAVIHNGVTLTYGELYERAGKLSSLLQTKGLNGNKKVALYMPRGIDMLSSILAVFYSGGAYVPIDVSYPGQRVREILVNSESELVLTQSDFAEPVEMTASSISTLKEVLIIDDLSLEAFTVNEEVVRNPDDLAYIIYTSGTTGKPKGVMIHQLGMVNHLLAKVDDLGLNSEDTVAQTASPCFDISVWQFLSALLVGGKTVIIDGDKILEPKELVEELELGAVTIFESVPSLITTFLDGLPSGKEQVLNQLRWMIPTGEALTMGLVKKWYSYFPQIPLLNAYGPTEASDDITHYIVPQPTEGQSTVPIGKPVQNTHIYILDSHLNLCPVGVKGEICVAGLGVGKGYWKDEEKTNKAFVSNPFGGEFDGVGYDTLYKTGDIGYYQEDGNIVCLGRKDSQVKIRGFRVELEEIESHLALHHEIDEIAVIAKEKEGTKFLVAYYVSGEALEGSALRNYLLDKLPDYMVPSYFVHLIAMPLTANGKLDRKALPDVEAEVNEEYVAAQTEGEKVLVEVWSQVLRVEKVGTTDNFFLLGGDSIKSIQICSRARGFGYELSVQDIFANQTIRELSLRLKDLNSASDQSTITEKSLTMSVQHEFIEGSDNGKSHLISSDLTYKGLSVSQLDQLQETYAVEDVYPLSSMQEGMLFHSLLDVEAGDYFGQSTYQLQGNLDIKVVEDSMNELMARYAILRTVFLHEGYIRPIQVVLKERKIDFTYIDIRHEGLNGSKQARVQAYRDEEKSKTFDLSRDVLMRLVVVQTGDNEFDFIWSHHHVLMDGWCIGIIVSEFTQVYTSTLKNQPIFLSPTTPYASYIQWLENWQKEASETYWRSYLSAYETPAVLPQKEALHTEGLPYLLKKQHLVINREETKRLDEFSRKHGVTINTVFQCAWGLLLAKYNNVNDVVFGSVVSGRPVEIDGVETMIGLFINTIPMRISHGPEDTVGDLLKKTQDQSVNSGPHHYYSLSEIQALSEMGGDLIDHIVAFENFPVTEQLVNQNPSADEGEIPFEIKSSEYWVQTNYDLSITVIPSDEFEVIFDYNNNKYEDGTIADVSSYLKNIIFSFVQNYDKLLKEISLFNDKEQEVLKERFTSNLEEDTNLSTIQERLNKSFKENRNNAAIEYKGETYDYGTVELTADKIAQAIDAHQLPSGSNIGILCEDRYWLICSMLGILKSRMAFVPLENTLPENRLSSMIVQTGTKLIITDQGLNAGDKLKATDETIKWLAIDEIDQQVEVVFENKNNYQPDDHVYVYFTSGSTGNPKGVIGKNKGLSHFINWEITTFNIDNSFRISQFTNPGFDVFMRDIFVPLCAGGTICIPEENILSIDQEIYDWITEQRINLIHCVPSLFKLIQKDGIDVNSFSNLKYILLAGEKILPYELKEWYKIFDNNISLVNIYGPTETTLAKGYYKIQPEDSNRSFIPVKAISGAQFLILDSDLNVCSEGGIGEIYIRTPYKTAGYLGLQEANQKSFILNPFSDNESDLIYKTGDLGKEHENGEIEILGRLDHQVKIRGIRIELDDIKENICNYPGITDAVVVVREDAEAEKFIASYIVSGSSFDSAELRVFLDATLPPNMIPSYLISIAEFPLMPNGKIDRKALPDPSIEKEEQHELASNEVERKLVDIWSEVLRVDKELISTTKSFFEMGGHSVKVFHIINRIQQEFSVKLKLGDIFNNASVKEIGILISDLGKGEITQIPKAAIKEFYAASPAQERMYYQHLLHEKNTAFNISIPIEIKGEVDIKRFNQSFQKLVERHEGLRTSFMLSNDGVTQTVNQDLNFEIEILDPTNYNDVREAFNVFVRPFDLSMKSLMRCGLLINESGNYLFVDIHHIVSDGNSLDILINDFKKIHFGEELQPLELRYVDYTCWLNENKEKLHQQEVFWSDKLSGQLPRTDLPMSQERDSVDAKLVSFKELEIGDTVYEDLKTIAATYKVSDFMLLISAYYILLHKMSGNSDLIIGTEVLGRTQSELKDIVGTFVNVLPLRVQATPEKPYVDFLNEVKESVLEAFDNQDFQFDQMVSLVNKEDADLSRNPIFDFYFSLANTVDSGAELDELKFVAVDIDKRIKGEYEFVINVVESNRKMMMSFIYSNELYDDDTIDLLMHYYHNILTDILKNQTVSIEDINMENVLDQMT